MGSVLTDWMILRLLSCRTWILALTWCCCGILTNLDVALPAADLPAHPATPEARADAPRVVIAFRSGQLSVDAHEAPWAEVLNELARHTGIQILIKGRLAGELTDEFEALPLDQGLRRLFREVDTVFFYAPTSLAGAADGTLTQVWLWPREYHALQGRQIQPPLDRSIPVGNQEMNSKGKTTPAIRGGEAATPKGELPAEGDQEERLKALNALAQQGDDDALRKALVDPDQAVQEQALRSLAAKDQQGAIALLLEMSKSDEPGTRLQALTLLHESGQADEATALSALRTALADENLRSYAIQGLAEHGGTEAMEALRETFRDPDPYVRALIIESMADQAKARPLLQEAIADPDETVRTLATFWLGQAVSGEQ